MMYWISRYWNRLAYWMMDTGVNMVWDSTGKNEWLLKRGEIRTKLARDIFCGRK